MTGTKYWLGILALASAVGFGIESLNLDYFEAYFFDLRTRTRPAPTISSHIQSIYVDAEAIRSLGRAPNFTEYSNLVETIESHKPKAVLFFISPTEIEGSPKDAIKFAATVEKYSNIYFATSETPLHDEKEKLLLAKPFEKFQVVPAPTTADRNTFAKDGVSRRAPLTFDGQPLLQYQVAQLINPKIRELSRVRGRFEYLGTDQLYIDFSPLNSFARTSMIQYLNEHQRSDTLTDKDSKADIFLIGKDKDESATDYVNTPYARSSLSMTKVELHANIIETLIRNSGLVKAPRSLDLILCIVLSFIVIFVVLGMRPFTGLAVILAAASGTLVLSYFAFWPFGIWIHLTHPLLSIFLCYYFLIPYRLILENRKSWEYFQKHKLLSEVEQLKTNFISMMSHDLKTPLARIQGMINVIIGDSNPISAQQREALDTIRSSTDDLNGFISTILNYAKIESQGVELHLQSRDINLIIEEVVKKCEFLAKLKHIQIDLELEPMFSIAMDPELIRQVIANLVENAIKYSNEKTKIEITSREVNNFVVVSVKDQGQGIPAEEISNIFTKFFRSKQVKNSPIKGSGLGLYLAKYFVELHGGNLTVTSVLGEGSTFTLSLPTEQKK